MHRLIRKNPFCITKNQAFRKVIECCAAPVPGRRETWISPEFMEAYTKLHDLGHAHSVECWLKDELAGGIYGVAIGGFFAGESMFHRANNASKLALHELIGHLRARGFALFDIQMLTPVTRQMGAVTVRRTEYMQRLAAAVDLPCAF
jgi:leucyl/phenylalanyl-tRNA--protein transferase